MSEEEQGFDINAGVDAIAADMGWETTNEEAEQHEEEDKADELQQEQKAEPAEEVAEEIPEVVAKAPPASWAKEQHERWAQIPPEAQEYIELREKQMLDGIEQYKAGHQYAQEFQRTLEPFRPMMEQFGVNEHQAVQNLFQWNQSLTSGSLEQKQQAFIRLGTDLGIIPQEGQAQIDPRTQELQQRLDRIERQEQQRTQEVYQQQLSRVISEVEAFKAAPENEHFEAVADDVIAMLQADKRLDLKTAYDKAVWANPITRAKEQAKLIDAKTKELAGRKTAEAKAAQKATSTNIKANNSNRQSAEPPSSWEETMAEVLRNKRAN